MCWCQVCSDVKGKEMGTAEKMRGLCFRSLPNGAERGPMKFEISKTSKRHQHCC